MWIYLDVFYLIEMLYNFPALTRAVILFFCVLGCVRDTQVLDAIVAKIPAPTRDVEHSTPLRARLVDSWFDTVR